MAASGRNHDGIPIIDLEREEIDDARRLNFAQKFLAGADLFDYACAASMAGIRWQNPGYTEEQVLTELRRRIALGEAIERRAL